MNLAVSVAYLLVFRLAIVCAGVVSMLIGYRLFCRGIETAGDPGRNSTIESSLPGIKFSLKNAAPGTAFALFGAVLISVMLIQSGPSVDWQSVMKPQSPANRSSSNETAETKFQVRGENQDSTSLAGLTTLGRELQDHGKSVEAERAFQEAVTALAEPMNDLASIYLNDGRNKQALGLAKLAVQMRPDEPRFVQTLSKAETATK